VEDINIGSVTEFAYMYLGSLVTYGNDDRKKDRGRATGVMSEFKNIWKAKA